jgi:hypothetical protein
MLEHIGHVDDSEALAAVEVLDRQSMRLVAKLLELMDIIFAEIEPNGHVAHFLRREKQRSIAEADFQPASPLSITSGTLDHSSRYRALALMS